MDHQNQFAKLRPLFHQFMGAARFGYFDYPEPVVVADTNFDRGVDAREFRAAADKPLTVEGHASDNLRTTCLKVSSAKLEPRGCMQEFSPDGQQLAFTTGSVGGRIEKVDGYEVFVNALDV